MTRFQVHVAFLAGAVALSAGACGGTTRESGSAPSSAPRSAVENQVNPQPRDRVQDGGRLTWPMESFPATFNFNHVDGPNRDHHFVIAAMMPQPFNADAAGTPHWDSNLLASEPTLVTDPKQVVTYTINPKARWYEGTPITWEDFYWQWRALNGTNKAYQIASANGYSEIENVARGSDDRVVVVTFKDKYADWQSIFSPLYPASTNKSAQIFNEGWKKQPLTAGGPFKFGRIDETAKTLTLVRNERWWGNPAKLEEIVFRTIDVDAQIDALANGEIDIMDIGPDVNKFQRAKTISGVELRIAAGPNFRHLTINGTGPILQDVKVRQALAMGIDRGAIARAMLGPLGIPPATLNNHIFMTNQEGYQDNSGDVGKYNPQRAAQLLDEAGWKLEGEVRRKNGRVLDINFVIPAAVTASRQESELIQNMLGQIGVKITINTIPSQDFFDKYLRPGQFDFTVFAWSGTPFPISSSKSLYAKPTVGPDGQLAIQQNYARIGSDDLDRLFDQATHELNRAEAIRIANRADALIWQEVHSLTNYQRPELWATKKDLANLGAFGFADIIYEDVGLVKK